MQIVMKWHQTVAIIVTLVGVPVTISVWLYEQMDAHCMGRDARQQGVVEEMMDSQQHGIEAILQQQIDYTNRMLDEHSKYPHSVSVGAKEFRAEMDAIKEDIRDIKQAVMR